MKIGVIVAALFVALAVMGFQCINDNFRISVNISGITGTFAVRAGDGRFNDCVTKDPTDYLDQTYKSYSNVRIYDIQVSTIGTSSAIVNGTATVNGTPVLTFKGPFSYFNTPRSVLTDTNMNRIPAGINAFINAVASRQPITFCGVGSAIPPPGAGDSVKIEVFGQIDAEP